MKASLKIGQVFGIAIRVHATFPLLLVWIAAAEYAAGRQWRDVVMAVLLTLAIFAIVVLHELAHALTARRFGVRTRDITLLPIGGVARLERIPTRPLQELAIAVAGPALNVGLAILLFGILALRGIPAGSEAALLEGGFLARLAWVNVALAAFNLLPAFPMDGGRVLRAVLAMRLGYLHATDIAAAIGKVFAVGLGIVGLATNPVLLLIAIFVWFGAEQEGGAVRLRATLEGVPVEDVMMTEFHVLSPEDELQRAVDYIVASGQQHFPVVTDGTLVGMLYWSGLLNGLAAAGPSGTVGDAMERRVRTARAQEPVERVLDRGSESRPVALPVLREGRIVGLFTTENLMESVMLRTAADRGAHRPHAFA